MLHTNNIVTDFDEGTRFLESNFDIANSKNYKVLGDGKGYEFTGNEMFKTPNGTSTISKKLKESFTKQQIVYYQVIIENLMRYLNHI